MRKNLQKLLPVAVISEIPAIAAPDRRAKRAQAAMARMGDGEFSYLSTILLGSAFSYLRG